MPDMLCYTHCLSHITTASCQVELLSAEAPGKFLSSLVLHFFISKKVMVMMMMMMMMMMVMV